jgi:MinD-like ATPase involved in chromosome partitioning or flagellar assembly
MSLFALASLKGAPGTTTLACLVAATWPLDRRVVVAECDPFGGDLAARFELSTTKGCLSLATAARRDPASVDIDPHVQRLPGGLEVLVGGSSSEMALAQSVTRANVNQAVISAARDVDVVADLGRLAAPYDECRQLLQTADAVGVLIGPDPASIAHAVSQRELLEDLCGERISLIIVGRGTYRVRDVETRTGIRVSAEVPHDPVAAAVASGASNGSRRLARSVLVKSARRIADSLVEIDDPAGMSLDDSADPSFDDRTGGRPDIQTVQGDRTDRAYRADPRGDIDEASQTSSSARRASHDEADSGLDDQGPSTTLKVLP